MATSPSNFVRIIEEYSCLYNSKLPEYSRKDVTDKAWREVARKTNASVSECQTRWKNIRNGFVRSLKLIPNSTSTKQKKLYYLHHELKFVLPFVKVPVYTSDVSEADDIGTSPEVKNENMETENMSNSSAYEESAESAHTASEESTESFSMAKFKRPKRDVANESFVEWMKTQKDIDSPRKMFLLSLLPDVESLSEEQMRSFRIKVLLLLEKIQSGSS